MQIFSRFKLEKKSRLILTADALIKEANIAVKRGRDLSKMTFILNQISTRILQLREKEADFKEVHEEILGLIPDLQSAKADLDVLMTKKSGKYWMDEAKITNQVTDNLVAKTKDAVRRLAFLKNKFGELEQITLKIKQLESLETQLMGKSQSMIDSLASTAEAELNKAVKSLGRR